MDCTSFVAIMKLNLINEEFKYESIIIKYLTTVMLFLSAT